MFVRTDILSLDAHLFAWPGGDTSCHYWVGDTSKLWHKFSHSTEENISGRMKNSKIDTSNITLHVVLGERKVFLESRILVSPCFFGGHNDLFLTNAQHSKLETTDLNGDHFLLGQQAAY